MGPGGIPARHPGSRRCPVLSRLPLAVPAQHACIIVQGSLVFGSWPLCAKGDGLIGRVLEQSRACPPPSSSLPGRDRCATQPNALHGNDTPGLRNGPALEVAVVHDHLSKGHPVQLQLH